MARRSATRNAPVIPGSPDNVDTICVNVRITNTPRMWHETVHHIRERVDTVITTECDAVVALTRDIILTSRPANCRSCRTVILDRRKLR